MNNIKTKICKGRKGCGQKKSLNEFYKNKSRKDGYQDQCKSCRNIIAANYTENNKEKITLYSKEYYKNNKKEINSKHAKYYKDNINKVRFRQSEYRKNNKEKEVLRHKKYQKNNKKQIAKYKREYNQRPEVKKHRYEKEKNKRNNDLIFRNKKNVSSSVRIALKKSAASKIGATFKYLTFTPKELTQYLINTIKNYDPNEKYHIDHIIPHCMFEYDSLEHPNFKLAWKLENLQYLPAKENIKLRDKGFCKLSISQIKEKMKQSGIYTDEEIASWIPPKKLLKKEKKNAK